MRKFISLALSIILVFTMAVPVFAVTDNASDANEDLVLYENMVQEMLITRENLLMKDPIDIVELNNIDLQLHRLGVEFLTSSEVAEQFPDAFEAIAADSPDTSPISTNTIDPRIAVPSSSVNSWTSYRISGCVYNGVEYNLQRLTAVAANDNSALVEQQNIQVTNQDGVKEKLAEIALSFAVTYSVDNANHAASEYITWLNLIGSLLSGSSSATEISLNNAFYAHKTRVVAQFTYVRLEGHPDTEQDLSHIATKCSSKQTYQYLIDQWDQEGDGTWESLDATKTVSKDKNYVPSNYSSVIRPIQGYLDASRDPLTDYVESFDLTDAKGHHVWTVYPLIPAFPLHCE